MKILFYGDSITDAGRDGRSPLTVLGYGYPLFIGASLMTKYPGQFTFDDTGVSGNRIVDLYSRIKTDCWNRKPDVISILIGVNDVWHEVAAKNGVEADRFEKVYRMLIEDTLKVLPDVKLILMEPFILDSSVTAGNWELFYTEVRKRAEITEKLAKEYNLVFVPLQQMLTDACKIQPAEYWLADGVHPAPAGRQLIANAWIDAFEKNILGK